MINMTLCHTICQPLISRRCDGFHRTMRVLSAASQALMIERIFGEATPERISEFNEMVAGTT